MALVGNFATTIQDVVDSLTAADKMNISEAIYQSAFQIGSFANAHTVVPGQRNGSFIPIIQAGNHFGTMPNGNEQSCDLNDCDPAINYATYKWILAEYNCRKAICMRTVDEDWLVFWNMYRQRLEDPTQEPDAQAVLEFLLRDTEADVMGTQWRVGYLGEESSGNPLLKGVDGFFTQAQAITSSKPEQYVQIQAAGTDPTGLEIYNALAEAYTALGETFWGGETDVVFKMTWAMGSKFLTFLNTANDFAGIANCNCLNPANVTGARTFIADGLTVFGIPVEIHREIDLSMNAVAETNKYQAILARKSNLLVGTNTIDKMEGFEMFFDKLSRKVYIDSMVYLGVAIPLQDEIIYISTEANGSGV